MNAKTSYSKKNSNSKQSTPAKVKKEKKWYVLLVKFLILLGIVVSVIVYTDKKGYFEPDQSNNHTSRKWNSYYDFTEKDTVDVVLVGNSHCYAGVNPKNLSAALGATCFVLASPGTTIMDSYFCLEEALKKTSPKVAIIETYGISNTINHELTAGGLSDQFKSFNARKDFKYKILSMFQLFSPEYYISSWSNTIRNHDFIFRDRNQLKINMELMRKKPEKEKELYLGRFVSFTTGIEDSTIAKYQKLGAPVNGDDRKVNEENIKYVRKIVELCKKHQVTPIFVTLPMYYQHVKNYDAWKNEVAKVIKPTGAAWLDLQSPYDTVKFDRSCFENTYDANQHMTYTGSLVGAYKIAHYLKDSLKLNLPQRNLTQHWNDLFYGEEGYFENYPSRSNDTTNILICSNQKIGMYTVKDCIMQKKEKNNVVLLKIAKDGQSKNLGDKIRVLASAKLRGQIVLTYIEMYRPKEYDPIGHYLYEMSLLKEAELVEVKGIEAL